MENLRTSENKEEIFSVFLGAIFNQTKVTLWQNRNEKRNVLTGMFCDINESNVSLRIISSGAEDFIFEENATLYFHSKYISMLFKQEIHKISKDTITIKLPSKVFLLEKRESERHKFDADDEKIVIYNHHLRQSKMQRIHKAKLLDISNGGAALSIPAKQSEKLKVHELINILYLSDQKIPVEFLAEIVRFQIFNGPSDGADEGHVYCLGIRFLKKLNHIIYLPKRNRPNRNLEMIPAQGIFVGHGPQEQEAALEKIESQNFASAQIIRSNLDFLQNFYFFDPFMKQTIFRDFDREVMATALRLAGKDLVASILSDISHSLRQDLLERLQNKKSISFIIKAQEKLVSFLKAKAASGEITLKFDNL